MGFGVKSYLGQGRKMNTWNCKLFCMTWSVGFKRLGSSYWRWNWKQLDQKLKDMLRSLEFILQQCFSNLNVHENHFCRFHYNADSDSVSLGWSLKFCMSNEVQVMPLILLNYGPHFEHEVYSKAGKWNGEIVFRKEYNEQVGS